jgi:hypothetical protein
MRTYAWKWILAAAVVPMLAPTSPVVAGDQVPLKGEITIVPGGPTVVISVSPLIVQQTRSITGVVSHLGRCEGVIVQNINLSNPANITFAGSFELVGASGDSASGDVTGALVPTSDPGFLAVEEVIVITGGTGRFARAIGGATGEGRADRSSGEAIESFRGTISRPNSRR